MENKKVTASEINSYPISDLLDIYGFPFTEQIGVNRHYMNIVNNDFRVPDFTVNTLRNQWISRETGEGGGLTSLLRHLQIIGEDFSGDYSVIRDALFKGYIKQYHAPKSYSVTPVRIGKAYTMLVNRNDTELFGMMSRKGISAVTVSNWCHEILIHDRKTGKEKLQLAFPCDNHEFYIFNGTVFRPLDGPSISTFGEIQKDQNCYIYHNPIDYLAMRELRRRNRVDFLFRRDYHLVVNGDVNTEQASQFLKDNPDFSEVRAILPKTDEGRIMFGKLDDACRGTLVNCDGIYKDFVSLSDKVAMQIPGDIKATLEQFWKEKENEEIGIETKEKKSEEKKVKEKLSEKISNTKPRGLGAPQKIIITDERRGMKI